MSPVNFFYDTEFLEDGSTIELISIGIIRENGEEYYAVNSDADWDRIRKDDWLMDNVVRHLPTHSTGQVEKRKAFGDTGYSWGGLNMKSTLVKPKWVIRNEVREFLLADTTGDNIRLWADYAAYDHVALAQLWGKMIHLPKRIPMWTHDLQQLLEKVPKSAIPEQESGQHNALEDARHNLKVYQAAMAHLGGVA